MLLRIVFMVIVISVQIVALSIDAMIFVGISIGLFLALLAGKIERSEKENEERLIIDLMEKGEDDENTKSK